MPAAARVVSLHVHPEKSGLPMISVEQFDLVAEKGIVQDRRYFGRTGASGKPARRQVSLIEREQLAEHAATLGVQMFAPGLVRSNIEVEGTDLVQLVGKRVRIGSAILNIGEPRTPCHKMDAIVQGLRALMENGRQGVIAQVVQSGTVRPGDIIELDTAERDAALL